MMASSMAFTSGELLALSTWTMVDRIEHTARTRPRASVGPGR